MKKLVIAVLTTAALSAPTAGAQSSSTTAPTGAASTATTSTTTLSEVKPAATSKWGAGVLFIYDKAMRVKTLEEDSEVTEFDTQTHFSVKYKLSNSDSVSAVQRMFYSKSVIGNSTLDAYQLGNLRLQETHTTTLAGGDFAMLTRLTLPTVLESRRDLNMLGSVTLIPYLSWAVTPKLSLGYAGYFAGSFYDDANRPQADGSKKFVQGAEATTFAVINQGYVNYSFSDKLSFSQALGLSTASKNRKKDLTNLQEVSRTIEASSTLAYKPVKKVALTFGVNQSAAIMEGSVDTVNGKALAYEETFVPFARDQTTYEVTGSVTF